MLGVVQLDIVEDKILSWEGEEGKFKQIGPFGNKWERVSSRSIDRMERHVAPWRLCCCIPGGTKGGLWLCLFPDGMGNLH